MRRTVAGLTGLALALVAAAGYAEATPPKSPADVIKASAPDEWEDIAASDLLVFNFDGGRDVVIQLAPAWAPEHIENIKLFARTGYWRDGSIYRVADNWVTQWGADRGDDDFPPMPKEAKERPAEEYERSGDGLTMLPSGSVDPYSSMAGFIDNWPAAKHDNGRVNLAFCYGTVGVARGAAPDTGTGSELFVIIGTPSRRLDRNYTAVGRVVSGIEHLSGLPRGTAEMGMYAANQQKIPIRAVRMASDMPAAERPHFQVMKQSSASFATYLKLATHREDYGVGSPGAALCAIPVPVRPKP